jgi:hypothetical protein
MLFAAHIVVAGTIGGEIGNPFLAFLAGLIIHLLLDAIPHFDTPGGINGHWQQWLLTLTDTIIAILIVALVVKPDLHYNSGFVWGALGGILIDIFDVVPFWKKQFQRTKIGKKVHAIHEWFHSDVKIGFVPGMLVQYVAIIICLLIFGKI